MQMLLNKPVRFSVSEPEEFYFDNGEGPFDGKVVGYSAGVMFVKVRSKLQYNNQQLRYLAVLVRYDGDSLSELKIAPRIVVNFAPLAINNGGDVSTESLVNLAKKFRGQHFIGEIWLIK
jgi:hypothetical protein